MQQNVRILILQKYVSPIPGDSALQCVNPRTIPEEIYIVYIGHRTFVLIVPLLSVITFAEHTDL